MTPWLVKFWLAASLLVAVAIAPFLAQGDQQLSKMRKQNAMQIARMSDSQRARLMQNEAMYRVASPETKTSLQSLHHALQQDEGAGGELNTTLQRYDAWLKTVEPFEREQLDSTRDPQERIAMIRTVLANQRERNTRRSFSGLGPGGDRRRMGMFPTLDEKSYRAVMTALEEAAGPRLTAADREELSKLQGVRHDFRLLRILRDFGSGVNPKPLLEEPPVEFKTVAANIEKYLADQRAIDFVQGKPPTGEHADDRMDGALSAPPEIALAQLVVHSLAGDLMRQWRAMHRHVAPDQLEAFLLTLPPEKQYDLLAVQAADFQYYLRDQYLQSKGVSDLPSPQMLAELVGRRGPGRPFGFGGPRDGRGGRNFSPDDKHEMNDRPVRNSDFNMPDRPSAETDGRTPTK